MPIKGHTATSTPDPTTVEFFDGFYAAKNARDFDAMMEHFSPDIAYQDMTVFMNLVGADELRKAYEDFLGTHDARFELRNVVGSVQTGAAVEFCNHPPSLGPDPVCGVAVIEFRDGVMSRWTDIWDGSLIRSEDLRSFRLGTLEAQGGRPGPLGEVEVP
jgi:hypothetical protein